MIQVETPHGAARIHEHPADDARAMLVLGHGAGGGVGAPDLVAATEAALSVGVSVALVEQPYRVAGRRSPAPAAQLDAAWTAAMEKLPTGLPLIVGGRSLGARVACRTATTVGAVGVVCLAFPLQPPGGRPSRLPELDALELPTLVVQGERDPFGIPPAAPNREVVVVPGDHSLRAGLEQVRSAVGMWLATRLRF